MNKDELFRDMLSDGEVAGFEEAVLRKTITTARRTHRTRIAIRAGVSAAVVALIGLQMWPRHEAVFVAKPPVAAPALAAHKTLRSQPFTHIVRTETAPPTLSLALSEGRVPSFTTAEAGNGGLRFIGDDELLALFKGTAVALIQRPGGGSELLILDQPMK